MYKCFDRELLLACSIDKTNPIAKTDFLLFAGFANVGPINLNEKSMPILSE
jgi:hypothetical protein